MRQWVLIHVGIVPVGITSLIFFIQCNKANDFQPESSEPVTLHLTLGNPSRAADTPDSANNYLIVRHQYALSYNSSKGTANWVSWHLNTSWLGTTDRCDCFETDYALPESFVRISRTDYTNSGFDRGHLCPSADRTANEEDNATTFLMTNIMPQAPNLNRQTWARFEDYCRQLAEAGYELYIIAGGYGVGGSGSRGGIDSVIALGKVHVPAYYWKIALVLPDGDNDLERIDATTRVIAVVMPNHQQVTSQKWPEYRTSVDAIEAATGFDFFSNIPVSLQELLEQRVDDEDVP